jgi:hypothetical protein
MLETKKPYLANLIYTLLGFLVSLFALYKDERSLSLVILLGLQLILLYKYKLKIIKIFYILQLGSYLVASIGFYFYLNDNINKNSNSLVIAIFLLLIALNILSYLAVEHQIAKDGGEKEANEEKKMKVVLVVVVGLLGFIAVKTLNPMIASNNTTTENKIFNSSSFEDCLLENLKNAQTTEAIALTTQACRNKFPSKSTEIKQGINLCKIYWDGWKFSLGDMTNNKDFTLYKVAKDGVDAVEVGIPKQMLKAFETKSIQYKDVDDLFQKNVDSVLRLCN